MIRSAFPDDAAAMAWAANLAREVESSEGGETAIRRLSQEVGRVLKPYAIGVFLRDDTDHLVLDRENAYGALAAQPVQVSSMAGIVGKAVGNRMTVLVPDVARNAEYIRGHLADAASALAVPLISGNESHGAIDVEAVHPGAFDELDESAFEVLASALAAVLSRRPPGAMSPVASR